MAACLPVPMTATTSASKLAPVPGCGLSSKHRGARPSIMGLQTGVSSKASALVLLASESKGKSLSGSWIKDAAACSSSSLGLFGTAGIISPAAGS